MTRTPLGASLLRTLPNDHERCWTGAGGGGAHRRDAGPVTMGAVAMMCTQMWRDDDGQLQFCALGRGHQPECTTAEGWLYSETVEMV